MFAILKILDVLFFWQKLRNIPWTTIATETEATKHLYRFALFLFPQCILIYRIRKARFLITT